MLDCSCGSAGGLAGQGIFMRNLVRTAALAAFLAALPAGMAAAATATLYAQDFEAPDGWINDGGDVNLFRSVNQLYANQPPGFVFAQSFTSETLRIGGTEAFGTGFVDPDGRGGQYVLGQLSTAQDDLLGLAFNIGAFDFLNFRIDISSIDLDRHGGPFVPGGGAAPTFRFSLFDNPAGTAGLGGGTALSFVDATAPFNVSKNSFLWTTVNTGLSAAGNTNGNVILRIDVLDGGYAAFDNIVITADDVGGGVPGIPEPASWAMLIAGFGMIGALARRRRASLPKRLPLNPAR